MLRSLRQPRYAALGVLMLIVAIVCVAAGTWQVFRFEQKKDENDHLRDNARLTATLPGRILPLAGHGTAAPTRDDVEFRALRVTGTYDAAHQSLVRSRTLDEQAGFLVLTPLQTRAAVLLVVRGFVAQPTSGAIPEAPPPPAGRVTILARAQAPETRDDRARDLTGGQVQSINPAQQARRLGVEIYDGYGQLEADQPGSDGLRALPRPDLSNPAGGALEPQHFAYVIQWYLFAALALAAPFAMIRAERKRGDAVEIDTVPAELETEAVPEPPDDRARKLADRYGRPVR